MSWERVNDVWHHCDRPAWLDDDGATCSKCQASMTWADDQAPSWVFHNLDTGTIEQVTSGAYFVAVDGLADEDRQVLEDSELAGWHGFGLSEVVSRVGVPVSDVLAVWSAVQAAGVSLSELGALMNTAATVDRDDQTFDNLHRCTDCGVTGGGVQNGLCQDCAARAVEL